MQIQIEIKIFFILIHLTFPKSPQIFLNLFFTLSSLKKLINLIAVFAVVLLASTSCKEYQEEMYEEVSNSETAFVIPLEASSKSGAKLSPAEYNSHKVMSKKILIPTRWHQNGRMWFSGKWVPTVKVIKVNRAPVNGNWSGKNAITVESQDSIDFSVAFNCTAEIPDENAATYLYGYPAKDLSSVMNSEIRQMVQQIVSEVSARYVMDQLRSKKSEIVSEVRKQVIPHFAKKGIVVTTLGMSSGFQYANAKIQESLDSIVVVQHVGNFVNGTKQILVAVFIPVQHTHSTGRSTVCH